jgi:pimeloyl-ACP methyl ester carboxylesterase
MAAGMSSSAPARNEGPADETPQAIVIGFMGGNVAPDDATRNELIISNRLHASYPHGVYFQVLENRHVEDAHRKVLQLLRNHNSKTHARIILYGHSWGASAVVTLADELKQDRIPVLLTIQVDSVQKKGQNDRLIPDNVARAINFYQPDGMLHGRPAIAAADPARTQILGNFRYAYKEAPPSCNTYPWYERMFIKTHIAIECDPVLWTRIENLIRESLGQPDQIAAHAVPDNASHATQSEN